MEIKIFQDALDALERVCRHLMAVVQLPKRRRDELLTVISDAYQMLDRALLMVIGRIGRVLDRAENSTREDFESELSKLGWDQEWRENTRELSISSGLRRLYAELGRANPSAYLSQIAVRDWNTFKDKMYETMADEGGLSERVTIILEQLSTLAEGVRESDEQFSRAVSELTLAREQLERERRRLIKAESAVYSVL